MGVFKMGNDEMGIGAYQVGKIQEVCGANTVILGRR